MTAHILKFKFLPIDMHGYDAVHVVIDYLSKEIISILATRRLQLSAWLSCMSPAYMPIVVLRRRLDRLRGPNLYQTSRTSFVAYSAHSYNYSTLSILRWKGRPK